ncbi:hypothetical protein GF360_03290 [candidate division WWE3 bacterium]|nr:hypothetical protein [candidate division WWE3 bacterium]
MYKILYKNVRNTKLKNLAEFRRGSWIYVENPTHETLEDLAEKFQLDLGLLGDSQDLYEMPRIEREEGMIYIYTRFVLEEKLEQPPQTRKRKKLWKHSEIQNKSQQKDKVQTVPLLITIGKDFLLTITNKDCLPLKKFIKKTQNINTTQKTKLLLQILLNINHEYNIQIHEISRKIQNLGTEPEKVTTQDVIQFVEYERTLNDFLSSLIPTNLIFQRILHGKYLELYEEDEELMEDLSLSNGQLIERTKSTLKNIVNIREAYSTIMSEKLNKTMKALTSVTILLTIPTLVFSFYGMNVQLPIEGEHLAYLWIFLSSLGIMAILGWVFKKRNLI